MEAYRKEIDGLRAVAVTLVLLSHAGFRSFRGGYVGVDVFFVISGYLITRIIISESVENRFDLGVFFERRVRRIFPALYATLFGFLPFAYWILGPAQFKNFTTSAVSAIFFVSNFYFAANSGYFDVASDVNPLLHTWSLSVEWQFYLIFPFVWIACRRETQPFGNALLLMFASSLFIAQYASWAWPTINFFLLPSRIWELLIGAITYLFVETKIVSFAHAVAFEAIAVGGLLSIFASSMLFSAITPMPGVVGLLPTMGAAAVIITSGRSLILRSLLANPVLQIIGLSSYSVYLWHYPLFALARVASVSPLVPYQFVPLICASLILGYLSWRFVEAPFRNRRVLSTQALKYTFLSASLVISGLGVISYADNGLESIYVQAHYGRQKAELIKAILEHTRGSLNREMADNGKCHFWTDFPDEVFEARFIKCSREHGPATLVLGDSHAMNIFNSFSSANLAPFIVGVSQGGCRPYERGEHCHYEAFGEFLSRNHANISVVVFHQSGSHLLLDLTGMADSQKSFEADAPLIIAWDKINALDAYLQALSEKANVVWLGPFVEGRVILSNPRSFGDSLLIPAKSIAAITTLDKSIKDFVSSKPSTYRYISLAEILDIGPDSLKVGDCITFRDVDHFSKCGERLVGEKLKDAKERGGFDLLGSVR
jgi:peptidoglycan/LPS O-acetylase OafA/YrhL